jgi:UDP-N-acetyl-D-mannosaminuronate dehydrogenase
VLLLGVTYKAGVSDERESPALPLARRLLELGADLAYHDPYVPRWSVGGVTLECVPDLNEAVAGADLVVLLQAHPAYDLDEVSRRARRVLDTRGTMSGANVERL